MAVVISSSILVPSSSTSLGGWVTTGKPLKERIRSRNGEDCGAGGGVGDDAGAGFTGDFVCDLLKKSLRMLALKVVV